MSAWHNSSAVLSLLAYSGCSISMVLVNKLMLSAFLDDEGQKFKYNAVLLGLQGAVGVAMLLGSRAAGFLTFTDIDMKRAKLWIPVNLFFIAMLYTSFRALAILAVPLVTIFKNITNLAIVGGAWYLFGEDLTWGIAGSLAVILTAAVAAGFNDVLEATFNAEGYAWMLANCACTAAYVLYMRASVQMKMSRWDKAYYNNLLMVPLSLVLAGMTGELPGALDAPQLQDPWFIGAVIFSGAVGFLLNVASLWCIEATSATTYAVTGALNKIPLVILGVFIFNDELNWKNGSFVVLGIIGGYMYGQAAKQAAEERKRLKAQAAQEQSGASLRGDGAAGGDEAAGEGHEEEETAPLRQPAKHVE